jgi:exodeoxyribonuclease VII small subunit
VSDAAAASASGSAGDAPAAAPVEELSYTEASRELDAIVDFFEQREVDVDVLVTRLERASALIDELDKRLRRTRAQVEELVPRLESVSGDGGAGGRASRTADGTGDDEDE